jgi:DNA-binding transcriptional regulator YiaG
VAIGATLMSVAASPAESIGTIAIADQLRHLRARVPLSERDVARTTGADEATVRSWLERKTAPMGAQANRLAELVAVLEEMALNVKPEGLAGWLFESVPALDGRTPGEVIAEGGYERVMDLALGLSAGVFT